MHAHDAIQVEVFNHLFSAAAEEMGAALMRAALSPNIKERRDFSCALFDADGAMLAQAAHIPVHLGSTPLSVQAAIARVPMRPGDAVLLNDPFCGGTHLPDLTLVSPVFAPDGETLWFYVANRAHHADVGGIAPGSMPMARHIDEEGWRTPPRRLDEPLIASLCAAARTPREREGDLRAQLAANRLGAARLRELVDRYGFTALRAVGARLQDHAEAVMRAILRDLPDGVFVHEDALDDDGFGHGPLPIRVALTIDGDRAVVDFTGSAPQTEGPVNAVLAITLSACMYAFRCLAPPSLPTNAGVMRPISVIAPPGSLLDARYPAAVSAGNVETSQRIVDVVLGALARALPARIPAASCGSMNNITIGAHGPDGPYAYYETIAGGAGAAPCGPGASAVHTHMTNTLNTPIEALEHAYPFRVERYAVRHGSGGAGLHRGGDGVVRAYRFDAPATVTLQTERRLRPPPGLAGGAPGAPGVNRLIRGAQTRVLPPKCTLEVEPGDLLVIETPGGGGWGSPAP